MQKTSSLFINNIKNMPLWVKQVIAKEVGNELNKKLSEFSELTNVDDLFQYLIPKVTIKGRNELTERKYNLSDGYYTFLNDLLDNSENNIFEITIKNNWTLSDTAKIFIRLEELEFIQIPAETTNINMAIASFIASKIKTGEFLKKIGKISTTQLEQALRYQKQLNEEGRHIKMASILIKMGFITDKGLDSLLTLKDEAKKRFPLGIGFMSIKYDNEEDRKDSILRMQKEIARLENENLIMKKRLKKMLNING